MSLHHSWRERNPWDNCYASEMFGAARKFHAPLGSRWRVQTSRSSRGAVTEGITIGWEAWLRHEIKAFVTNSYIWYRRSKEIVRTLQISYERRKQACRFEESYSSKSKCIQVFHKRMDASRFQTHASIRQLKTIAACNCKNPKTPSRRPE